MANVGVDLNGSGLREVLAGLRFPAQRWQVIAEAQHWGATSAFLDELITLPAREYRDLRDVATALLDRRRAPREVRRSRATALPAPRLRRPVRLSPSRRSMRIAG
jgi:uncharacterized protein DUF2795